MPSLYVETQQAALSRAFKFYCKQVENLVGLEGTRQSTLVINVTHAQHLTWFSQMSQVRCKVPDLTLPEEMVKEFDRLREDGVQDEADQDSLHNIMNKMDNYWCKKNAITAI